VRMLPVICVGPVCGVLPPDRMLYETID